MSLSEASFIDCDNYKKYAGYKAYVLMRAYELVYKQLSDKGMVKLYEIIE